MKYFSNEIVFRGHPDKCCDQISAAILKECMTQDKYTRAGIEVVGGKGQIFITGEITTDAKFNVAKIAKRVLSDIGYRTNYKIIDNIGKQSLDIAQGVDIGGAGDQGMMFGYACNDTEQLLPTAMVILQEFAKEYDGWCKIDNRFLPDGKAQITGLYDDNFKLIKIKDFTISYQNTEVDRDETDAILITNANYICHKYGIDVERFLINPTGKFLIGGFDGDAGLTGRKIVVDAYQSFANVGGGCCVDSQTEFLTPDGWKYINEYKNGDLVAQWDDGRLDFVQPYAYFKTRAEKMYRIRTEHFLDMVLSENHDMVFYTSKGNLIKKRVKDVVQMRNNMHSILNGFGGTVPCYFQYSTDAIGIKLTDDEIRLQVAFCADGSILNSSGWTGRIRVKKEYKKERLKELFASTRYPYKETKDDEYSIFWYNPIMVNKSLKQCFLSCNNHQLDIIANECLRWDGNRTNMFRTTQKEDADFIQFVLMKSFNMDVSITCDDRVGTIQEANDRKYERKSICYNVKILKNTTAGLRVEKDKLLIDDFTPSDGYMYCFSVPSTMLVLRRNNRVFITGNCNGKDATKVDFSAAHMARKIACEYLTSHNLRWCEVQLSYAIGIAEPLAIYIDSNVGNIEPSKELYARCTPKNIIKELNLLEADYEKLAQFGHFTDKE